MLVSTLLKFILGQSYIYTTGLHKFDMLDLYAGIIPTVGLLCTLICSFFNILSISIISWFLTISVLNLYCFRGWEGCAFVHLFYLLTQDVSGFINSQIQCSVASNTAMLQCNIPILISKLLGANCNHF